ncbi:hypothetical protein HY949_02340 [Candidatus Gottesmanbacteria bacterium]|nr:hypothetical protein [Candidatus Gottesmanbacteria bacterium]
MNCKAEGQCGFYRWLINERPDLVANTACGKPPDGCGRLNPDVPHKLDTYGPTTMDEALYSFPDRPNHSGREQRTGVSSCAQWGDLFEGAEIYKYVE